MSDLTKRLRGKYSCGPEGVTEDRNFGSYTPAICLEAADRIDELQNKLQIIRDALDLTWSASPEGRAELESIDRLLN